MFQTIFQGIFMNKRFLLLITLCLLQTVAFAKPTFKTLHWQTSQGTRVVYYQAMEVPMLDISIAFAAGSAYDGERFGLSALTTRLINQGNNGLNATTLAENLADTGAQFEAANNQDMIALHLKTLTNPEALQPAVELFTSFICHPDFPEDALRREKNQLIMAIAESKESPETVANQTFYQALYQKHPYAHPTIGSRESVAELNAEEVKQFYQRFFVNNNAVIVFVGAIDKATAEKLAEQITKALPKGNKAPEVPLAQPLSEELSIEIPFPSSQTMVRLGQLGINHKNPNYFPLLLGNYILGGGAMTSRLAHDLREQNGLTYGITSQFSPMPGLGPFLISFSTKNAQTQIAANKTRDILQTFVAEGPNEEELIAAKQYLVGSFPLSLGSNQSIADMLLRIAFYQLPDNYLDTYLSHIKNVSARDIKEAFQKTITPSRLLQITVGKA